MDMLLDDLSLKFFANYADEELKVLRSDGQLPFIWCDVPVNGIIPDAILNNSKLLVNLVDRIHNLLSPLHSEWKKFAIHCFDMSDGNSYFALLHEEACIEHLEKTMTDAESNGVVTFDAIVEWMELREEMDSTKPSYPQILRFLRNVLRKYEVSEDKIDGWFISWRDHPAHYKDVGVSVESQENQDLMTERCPVSTSETNVSA